MSNSAALAAAIGGTAVGIAGIVVGYLTSRGERAHTLSLSESEHEHQRKLARDERLHDELRAAYQELLDFLYQVKEVIARTEPMLGATRAPPALPPQETIRRMRVRASSIGSEEVMKAYEGAELRHVEFQVKVAELQMIRQQEGTGVAQARKDVQAMRRAFNQQIRELERLIRTETRA